LLTCAKLRVALPSELGEYLRDEHVRELLGDGDDNRYLAASDLICDRLSLSSLAFVSPWRRRK
jgi:hypothetical protein